MTSLRMRVVEAGARALDGRPSADLDGAAAAVLDAMLDCLAENADEWRKIVNPLYGGFAGGYVPEGTSVSISGMEIEAWLAVLREDR